MNALSRLYVLREGESVGVLNRDETGLWKFRYTADWMKNPGAFPLTPAFPLREEAFSTRTTKSFFENLIPEGETLDRLKDLADEPIRDEFDFLRLYGRECAGAFTIVGDNQRKHQEGSALLARKQIPLETIHQAWKEKKSLAECARAHEAVFSLAGAQDKMAVLFENGRISIPLDGSPTSHILKSPVRHWENTRDSVYNEYFCMRLAGLCGLKVPEVHLLGGEVPLYLVARFDRSLRDGVLARVHAIDVCQALGYLSTEKYEIHGGPGFCKVYELTARLSLKPIADLRDLLKWLFFNLILGNNDSHSKNLSFLHEGGGNYRLAPFYDLLSTAIYPQIRKRFAFKIGGQLEWRKVGRDQLAQMDRDLRLGRGASQSHLEATMDLVSAQAGPLAEECEASQSKVSTFTEIRRLTEARIDHLRRALANTKARFTR